ncbi:protein phosphatase 1 regulatory subunit 12B isoform X5 [Anopheles funestus]|uniref:protein phosphatase 1 regulatory subunit 12B isoform X5 n=1 Tax=Anopheles funestus TaxID=62324 RepID=UPI0020C70FCB|nr:protein phosphatase 1 regulatory subunit 12B isoform X5 [Anopheles funestus]
MSLDNRNTSAQFKRAEQLKRWEESEINKKLSGVPKSPSSRRIKFSSGCIFLAACVAGDKEEVEWLLKNGADIDTANVDGLTALHQACIDDNLDMVEFLVQKGADVNRKDNEGWTPLHATASCGFLSIARYLIENGADLASINSDGELAVDLASSDAMEDLIQHHLDEQGIDCDEARQAEERIMLSDATKWLRTDSSDCDKAHPKTGATAIHVAAAKGYIGVLKLLLEGRGDIDRQDVDGWTPLHAAAYWGQKEATQMLLNASADIDIQNYSGQLAIDIAQDDIVPLLKDARKNVKRTKRRPPSHGNRITDNLENSTETPTKVIRVEVKPIDSNKEKEAVSEKENKPTEPDVILRRTQSFESDEKFYQRYAELRARIQANSCPHTILPSTPINTKTSSASNNNNNNSSNTNNNNNNTTTTTVSTPTSNISSYLVQRSASLKDHRTLRKTASNLVIGSTTTSPSSATGPMSGIPTNTSIVPPATGTATAVSQATNNTTGNANATSGAVSPPTSPSGTPTTTPTAGQIRRSFVPPTRDEESETQRKAHAKRVRETRRSTQGVTLDEIKSAEQLVKKKNASGSGNENDTTALVTATSASTTITPSSPSSLSSSTSPSFTNNANATTISGTASINDRVPSVGEISDQQQQRGNHVAEGLGKGSSSEVKMDDVAVCASFTLAAPGTSSEGGGDGGGGNRRHRRSVGGNDGEEDDSKVTVSYTISAPVRQSSPSPRTTVNNSKESTDPLAGSDMGGDVPVVSATFHVPAVSDAEGVATTATIRTTATAGGIVSNSDSNTTSTITNTTSNNNTTSASSNTNHNTAATYTKRSLFDIDNANSLTLAEKLRHEANKYAIAAVADGDLDSHLVTRVPNSNSTTNSGGESNSNSGSSTNAPVDNSAVSAAAAGSAVPPSPTLRKSADSVATTGATAERRPSWRLKVDGGSKFKLEDASTPNAATQSSSVATGSVYESVPATQATEHGLTTTKLTSSSALAQRRAQQQNGDSTTTGTTGSSIAGTAGSRPLSTSGLAAGEQYNRVPGSAASAGEQTATANSGDASPLHHLRRPPKSTTGGEENKENDKENDNRSTAQATQAVIQRRRRQKRRSTGVVSMGIEDLDPDRQDSPVDGDDKETGSERGRSRVGSTASELDTGNQPQDSTRENGGDCIDYKALYEQEKADNDKLKMALRKKDEEVVTLKGALDRFTTATTKNNSLSELEKRERRAMERKMSEMEEELKLLQKYKTENERLRAENRALTRVVSKLTTSAQNQVHANKQ